MKVRILRTGESPCIPIPEQLLEEIGPADEIEVEVQSGRLVIRTSGEPRLEWEEAFRSMAERGDDTLLD
ncbi:MAG: AbrB/MazE/SpoVT family DNA-binding domain-containing protein [Gemmatimonadota bacterium]